MKPAILITILLLTTFFSAFSDEKKHPIKPYIPKISLFESIETIKKHLEGKTKYNYSDRNLSGVTLEHLDSHPKKGMAWVYRFTHRVPTLGNDLSIFHYTDGTIIEFHHGP